MTRIVRNLMRRPGERRCPYCARPAGEFPAYCHPCDWRERPGPEHASVHTIADLRHHEERAPHRQVPA